MDREFLDLYSDYLISAFGKVTSTGLSELIDGELSHDQITSRLRKNTGGSKELWILEKPIIHQHESEEGVLIFDDTLEHKPHSDENLIVGWYFDHTSNRSVKGINILNCVYHNDKITLPVAYEIIEKSEQVMDKKTGKVKWVSKESKNELMRAMLQVCCQNRLKFSYVLADSWFGSKKNMQYIKQDKHKDFIIAVKGNRLVSLSEAQKNRGQFVNLENIELNPDTCCEVYFKGLDFPVLITKQVFTHKERIPSIFRGEELIRSP